MKTSNQGIELITSFESYKNTAYYDAGGLYSIGYGTLIDSTSEQYLRYKTITQQEAKNLLKRDVEKLEKVINSYGYSLNQNQFDALISFGYNLGSGPVRLMMQRLSDGWTTQQVAERMNQYIKSDGKTLNGLIKRRSAETELFLKQPSTTQKIINTASILPGGAITSAFLLVAVIWFMFYKLLYK